MASAATQPCGRPPARRFASVALKVLHTEKTDGEPYRRFVREVETMRSLTESEGVLPLIDAHLPSRPPRRDLHVKVRG